jgi:hypothetical protein
METVRIAAEARPNLPEGERLTLSEFLSQVLLTGVCFCCGSSTELRLDGSGQASLACPRCGAEISGEVAPSAERSLLALQAA